MVQLSISLNKFLISRLIKNRATSRRKPTFDRGCSTSIDRKFLIERSTRVFFPVKNFSVSRIEQIWNIQKISTKEN